MNRLSTVSNDDDDVDDNVDVFVVVVVSSLFAIISEGLFLKEDDDVTIDIPDFIFFAVGDGLYNSSYSCK